MVTLVAIYVVGVAIGLIVMRDPLLIRIVTALAWPLGLVAFAVVVAILSIAAVYLWPVPILATLGVITAIWLAM